jgi:hypothetical protein
MHKLAKEIIKETASWLKESNRSGIVSLTEDQAKVLKSVLKSYDTLINKLDGDWANQIDEFWNLL